MQIAFKLILLSTIILMSNESTLVCPDSTETCEYGTTCILSDEEEEDEGRRLTEDYGDMFCDYDNGIYCLDPEEEGEDPKCGCLNTAELFTVYRENKCCAIHGSKCDLSGSDPYMPYQCCQKSTCVEKAGSSDGVCQCNQDYTFNEEKKICQKTVAKGEACDGVYEICATDVMCEENVCGGPGSGGNTGGSDEPGGNTGGSDEPGGNTGGSDEPGGNTGGSDEPGGNTGGTNEPGGNTGGTNEPGGNTGGSNEPGGNTGGSDEPGGNTDGSDDDTASKSKSIKRTSEPEDDSSFAKNFNFKIIYLFACLWIAAF